MKPQETPEQLGRWAVQNMLPASANATGIAARVAAIVRAERARVERLEAALTNARRAMICSVTGISDGITIHQTREWIADADAALARKEPK